MRGALRGTLVLAVCCIVGCGSAVRFDEPPAPKGQSMAPGPGRPAIHVVQAGDTLYAIATRYGLDYRDLARWNGLGDGSTIRAGQRLVLAPPAGRSTAGEAFSAPPPRWQWPTAGGILEAYGQSRLTQSGIEIGGAAGQPVVAAAEGQVVYAGSGLVGYGELLIIKHNDTWLTAYGRNEALLVKEGERVGSGQAIARLGVGPGHRPALHFEIRRNGEPVNPLSQLPRR